MASSGGQFNRYEQLTGCRVATTTALTVTYSNGSSNTGIGATLTNAGSQTALVIDGITLNVNDRVLVNNQSSNLQNGIYIVNGVGSSSSNWLMTRAVDFQTGGQLHSGMFSPIEAGSTNQGSIFTLVEPKPNNIGFDSILFFGSTETSNLGTAAYKAASDNTKAVLSSVAVPTVVNHIAILTDTNGTLGEDAATAINGGNIQAGLSGTAGTLASFPATASKGALVIAGVANTGNTNVTVSNNAHGQATVYSIGDIGGATGNLVNSSTAVSFWKGSAVYGGGSAGPITLSISGLPAGVGVATIAASTNAVSVQKAIFNVAGQVTVTFSGDPGADTTMNFLVGY